MKKYFEKLYIKGEEEFYKIIKKDLKEGNKRFVVTANPETFTYGKNDEEFNKLLMDEETTLIPDGIGIVKAANMLDYNVKERITGIDLANYLVKEANNQKKSMYLLGAKEEVVSTLVKKLNEEYPNINIVGYTNGYVKDKDKVFKEIIKLKPDICLVALGIPNQEKLIYKHIKSFDKGIFVGVGGSFDVMSGTKKRAPKIFIKTNTEWLYRIMCEPKRLKRFWDNNVKFIFKVKKEKRNVKDSK